MELSRGKLSVGLLYSTSQREFAVETKQTPHVHIRLFCHLS
jgi:hypothetical protein